MRSVRTTVAPIVLAGGIAVSPGADRGAGPGVPNTRVLRLIGWRDVNSLDPALGDGLARIFERDTCATLMSFRTNRAPNGDILRPEAAVGAPRVLNSGRTYVFTVRKGLRFSDGSPLTAHNFKRALWRVKEPVMQSPGEKFFSDVRRVTASGLHLRIDLSRPNADLPARLALPYACPVPRDFPLEPAGVDLKLSSGPYKLARHVPGSLLEFKRNPKYRGTRPHHLAGITLTVAGDVDSDIKAVEDGRADVYGNIIPGELLSGLAHRYGVNKRQLFRARGTATAALALNTSQPLFKGNVPLRRAVNFALDRAEIASRFSGGSLTRTPTDQILPSGIPGWRNYHLYPLAGPNLSRAKKLANGNLRGGKAVLWTIRLPGDPVPVIVSNLRAIGLVVQVKVLALPVLNIKASIPGAPYDMIFVGFPLDYPDPANAMIRLLGGANAHKPVGNDNFAYFDEPVYNRRMAADNRLTGSARRKAFSRLDEDIMRNEAPWAPVNEESDWLFVSKRVGCVKPQGYVRLDLATFCFR